MYSQTKYIAAFAITGDWAVQSKSLRRKFAQLTDEDLKFEKGKEDDLLKRLEEKLNKKREELIDIIQKGQNAKAK
ncbi:MAG: hypothetical protein ABIS36_16315 [Chryseolinea sp.]